jgi:prepilin-type N-terminal cleavage/methylation domain-containing protein
MSVVRLARALKAWSRSETGMTLPELLVSMTLMGVVATMFISVLMSIQQGVTRQQHRSEMNDQARLAVEQMDREIRSGNFLYDPATETSAACGGYVCAPNYSLRVYTQANAPTRTPPNQCVQWLIQDRKLLRRAWASGAGTSLGGWRVVATGIVNRDVTPAVPAFTLDPTVGGKVLEITLLVNSRFGMPDAPQTIRINTSLAIRNSASGDPCTPIPAS